MKVAILGAGFTGLTAALRLLQMGHQITLIEKGDDFGGLAGGFKLASWDWTLEKAYHHWFTNDFSVLNLAKELNYPLIINRPQTNVFTGGQILPLDSPTSLFKFPYLSLVSKIRTAAGLSFLKATNNFQALEKVTALSWLRKVMGDEVTNLIWEPLFKGKFGSFKDSITLSWFWARIKKRTPSLAYPESGFKKFAEKLASKVESLGGEILLDTEVIEVRSEVGSGVRLQVTEIGRGVTRQRVPGATPAVNEMNEEARRETAWAGPRALVFDKVISTLPSPILTKVVKDLPRSFVNKVNSIPHLHALNLILILKKPFMKNTYWLNITNADFPFLVLAEHTNFIDPKYYGNQHILYIGNYLPQDHPFLKMEASELLKVFAPFLKQINPSYPQSVISHQLFIGPFAQPVVRVGYKDLIPKFKSPLKNIYLANLDMVYPWDRGTNYAVEMGEKVAEIINETN